MLVRSARAEDAYAARPGPRSSQSVRCAPTGPPSQPSHNTTARKRPTATMPRPHSSGWWCERVRRVFFLTRAGVRGFSARFWRRRAMAVLPFWGRDGRLLRPALPIRRPVRRAAARSRLAIRSSSSSRKAAASTPTPTCAFGSPAGPTARGRRPSGRGRAPTRARPRRAGARSRRARAGSRGRPRARRGSARRPSRRRAGGSGVELDSSSATKVPTRPAARSALGVVGRQQRLVGDVEPDHRHVERRSRTRARPPPGRPRC